jgi:hypothetical protein
VNEAANVVLQRCIYDGACTVNIHAHKLSPVRATSECHVPGNMVHAVDTCHSLTKNIVIVQITDSMLNAARKIAD